MLIFDGIVDTVGRMSNGAFYRKVTADRIAALAGANPHVIFGFQEDIVPGTTVTNEGSSGAPGDMALTNASMWSGNGLYKHFGRSLQAGNKGYGLRGVGGASTERGTIPAHPGISAAGKQQYTWIYKFIMNGTGGGGGGRLSEASASHICFANAANALAMSIYDGAAWSSNGTGATVVYGYPMELMIVFDGTLVGDVNRLKMYLNWRDVTVNITPGIPDTMVDPSAYTSILNGQVAGWTRAWDGELGLFLAIPGRALTLAEGQELCELTGLFQPTVANQPLIRVPGHLGAPEYDFDGAANPNSDHLASFQVQPLKTQAGSILLWFSIDDFIAGQIIASMNVNGATDDAMFGAYFRGDLAGDTMEYTLRLNGATIDQLSSDINLFNSQSNMYAIRSDGSAIYMFANGRESGVAVIVGGNNGAWFADATDANVFSFGALRRAALTVPFNGKGSKLLMYDRALPQYQIQQIYARGFGPNGPRWFPSS